MNVAKINQLADLIEAHPEHPFSMGGCHTCYIAWVDFMQGGEPPAAPPANRHGSRVRASSYEVAEELRLDFEQKENLCFNWDMSVDGIEQRDYAVKRLRHFANTGELVLLNEKL